MHEQEEEENEAGEEGKAARDALWSKMPCVQTGAGYHRGMLGTSQSFPSKGRAIWGYFSTKSQAMLAKGCFQGR